MSIQLSRGSIQSIFNGSSPSNPVFQILDIKKITAATNSGVERYRVILSDGVYFQQAVLETLLNDLVTSNTLQRGCIVRTTKYTCSNVHNKKIIIVFDLEILSAALNTIGSPTSVEKAQGAPAAQPQANVPQPSNNNNNMMGGGYQPPQRAAVQQQNNPQNYANHPDLAGPVYPIKRLNFYQNRWAIKARVSNKGEMRTYKNQKGEGKLFSVDLVDGQGGEIRATMFNEVAEKLDRIFQLDGVYLISKGQLKIANKKFSSINNEYEMTLGNESVVIPVENDNEIPKVNYSFIPISEVQSKRKDDIIDIVGVVTETGEVKDITAKATGNQLKKRSLTLTDMSAFSIEFTLWGRNAENISWDPSQRPILAIKGAKVSDFNGKSLTSVGSTHIDVNPDIEQVHQLRGWYDAQGGVVNIYSLTTTNSYGGNMGGGGGMGGAGAITGNEPQKTFAQVRDELHADSAPFQVKGTITVIKHDKNPWYESCPEPKCLKRVLPTHSGTWSCEKCGKEYSHCVKRYILSLAASDYTGNQWMSAFNEVGTRLFNNTTADDMANLPQSDYEARFQEATYKPYRFTVRAKMENYQDQHKVRCNIVKIEPLDYVAETKNLIQQIQQFSM